MVVKPVAVPCAALQERAFQLGERLDVLSQVNQPSMIPHMADFEGKRFPYEVKSHVQRSSHCIVQSWAVMCCYVQ